ncbi:MAG: hypothetical protein KGL39_16640 [Patescibacteria group bacterium]|nr:hypothetical protein [Patescibacteria group bacterium]
MTILVVELGGKRYFKNANKYWTPERSRIVEISLRVVRKHEEEGVDLKLAHEVGCYLDKCVHKFSPSDAELEMCARRYLAGKRKASPPFTKTRKRAAAKARKARSTVPADVMAVIDRVVESAPAVVSQKAVNALVGQVLRVHKFNPQVVKELIEAKLPERKV